MDPLHILPFISTGITLAFAGAVLGRFLRRRRLHLLFWGLGLVMYVSGTFCEAYLALRWNAIGLRVWYLAGAMLTAAWLARGTLYLLVRKVNLAHALMLGLALVSVIAVGAVFTAPLNASAFNVSLPLSSQYRAIMTRSGLIVLLTILPNTYGTVVLVGGAIWSAWLFWRKQVLPQRMIGNIFIAMGALFPAAGGTLVKLGLGDWLYASELLGAILMFVGFWLATQMQVASAEAKAGAA
jgi:hypothetical protein